MEKQMKAAAIYARVSSDKQKEEKTIASQTAALTEFARKEGYDVPREWIFEDEGFSGASLVRPGLERLRDLAAEGQLEAILVYSPDRLSRKYAYQILLTEEFARSGVETVFVKAPKSDTPEDQLLLQFQGMIAEYERAQILERSRRGERHPHVPFERYADDAICHCRSVEEARELWRALADRFAACKLVLHPEKTKIVYCKDANRRGDFPIIAFDFLGFQSEPGRQCGGKERGASLRTAFNQRPARKR
jgi:predicted site-specific integrase-resolvase